MSFQWIRVLISAILMVTSYAAAGTNKDTEASQLHHNPHQLVTLNGIDYNNCQISLGMADCIAPDVEPSILNGRPEEMTIGARYINGIGVDDQCTTWDGDTLLPADYQIKLELDGNYGGHNDHQHNPQPIGQIEFHGQTAGDYQPQGTNGASTDTNPEISISLEAGEYASGKLTFPEASEQVLLTIWTNCDEQETGTDLTIKYHFKVKIDNPLIRLENFTSDNGISKLLIERSTNSHGDSAGYATSSLESDLKSFNDNMEACLPTGITSSLTVTAASLIHGGIYDIQYSWKSPHKNHRIGNDADIGLSAVNQNQEKLECIETSRVNSGLTSPVSTERIEKNSQGIYYVTGMHDHVHLVGSGSHFYPLDESSLWW